jgi:hypothetical protein
LAYADIIRHLLPLAYADIIRHLLPLASANGQKRELLTVALAT